jgi:hypothetical protein
VVSEYLYCWTDERKYQGRNSLGFLCEIRVSGPLSQTNVSEMRLWFYILEPAMVES